jgi:hypothetical protein
MAALFEVYSRTFGDEERRWLLDVGFTLRRFKFGVEVGPYDYMGNNDDWHIEVCVGPIYVQFTRLGKVAFR